MRMKTLASEMISKCANWYALFSNRHFVSVNFSTYQAFDTHMQRARKTTDFILPAEICVMINVIFSSKGRAIKLTIDSGDVSPSF